MVVLLDRYYYSTMAYQGARGIDPEFIKRENEKFAPKPDLVTYLDIPVSITGERIQNHRKDMVNLFEKAHYLEKVKAHFDAIKEDNFVRIDATGSVAEVHKKIMNAIRSVLNRA